MDLNLVMVGDAMFVKEICSKKVVHVTPEMSIYAAARLMKQEHVGDLIVTSDENGGLKPLGILTDRDIVTFVVADRANPDQVAVEDVMARHPVMISGDEDSSAAVRLMQERGVRRLPVVDARGKLIGIVTADDLLAREAHQLSELAAVSDRQIRKEGSSVRHLERFAD